MMSYVLIVDDEPDARDVLDLMLSRLKVETKQASNGFEAIEKMKEEPAGLVLLDLMMPRMDGYGVITSMQDDPNISSIPVVLITALASDQVKLPKTQGEVRLLQKGRFGAPYLRELVAEYMPVSS